MCVGSFSLKTSSAEVDEFRTNTFYKRLHDGKPFLCKQYGMTKNSVVVGEEDMIIVGEHWKRGAANYVQVIALRTFFTCFRKFLLFS